MHINEMWTDVSLVRSLLQTQFPHWAGSTIELVEAGGTDHALYRLGVDKLVRIPRTLGAAMQVEKEQFWLPRLRASMPIKVPHPLALGDATDFFPWPWSIYRWIPGAVADLNHLTSAADAAQSLGQFIVALARVNNRGAPQPGEHNAFRGQALAERDTETRAAITALATQINASAALAVWEATLAAAPWHGAPVWIHGDMQPLNFLANDGKLCAIIDFGLMAAGDPACDLMVAWTFLTAETRPILRDVVKPDASTWARGRGWALSFGLIALSYYQQKNPMLAKIAAYAISEVLNEYFAENI